MSPESGFREEKPASAESDNRVSIGEKSSANEVTVTNPDEFKHLVSRLLHVRLWRWRWRKKRKRKRKKKSRRGSVDVGVKYN